jgi:uncharacterized protein (TIGR03435 family)
MGETRFDIAAEPDAPGQPSEDQYRLMAKKLLVDRFQLKVDPVDKVFPVYALIVEKSSPMVVRSDPEFNGRGSIYVKEQPDGQTSVQFAGHTMESFANILMNFVQDRQIVDETGLKGIFDITLNIPTEDMQPVQAGGDDTARVSAFMLAVQAVGFRFVPRKEPVKVFVVDRLEMPSAN